MPTPIPSAGSPPARPATHAIAGIRGIARVRPIAAFRRRPPAWFRHPVAAARQSAVVLALIAVAVAAHVLVLLSQRAVNLDGSYSSLAPASPERVALDLTGYYTASVLLVGTYAALVLLAMRGRIRGLGRVAVLSVPIVLQAGLLFTRPWLSTDVLSYIAQGFVGTAAGRGNAYTDVPRNVLGTVIGGQLTALGWRPQSLVSPYGPLWTIYETLVMTVTRDVAVATVLMKIAPFAAALGSAALIWRILGMVRPRVQLLGAVVFLWNPVIIAELSGEGHLDGVMAFLVLLGLYATVRGRYAGATVTGAMAAMTKYIPVMLLPAQLAYAWRTAERPRDLRRRLIIGGSLAVGLVVLLYAPFWEGIRTLEGLRIMGQPGPWPTFTGFVYRYLERAYPGVDGGAIATILVTGGFGLYLLRTALRVRDAAGLLGASARTALAFVLVASPVFYPWYAVLPIALAALAPEVSLLAVILALTATSRFVAPLVDLRVSYQPIPAAAYTVTATGLFLCMAVAVAFGVRAVWAWAAAGTEETAATAS